MKSMRTTQHTKHFTMVVSGRCYTMQNSTSKMVYFVMMLLDLIVAATSKCLQLNLFIFQNVHGKIHVVNQISHPPCTRDAFLKYANEHYEPIVSDPDFSPAGVPKDQILSDLPEVIPPEILPTLKNVMTKRPQHSGPIETQDLGSDMERRPYS